MEQPSHLDENSILGRIDWFSGIYQYPSPDQIDQTLCAHDDVPAFFLTYQQPSICDNPPRCPLVGLASIPNLVEEHHIDGPN